MGRISFHFQNTSFTFTQRTLLKQWMLDCIRKEKKSCAWIRIIFVSEDFLLGLNKKYLQHTTHTDIITFPFNPPGKALEAELYIGIQRVKENAEEYSVPFKEELQRVMIHGILHLCGYQDANARQQKIIRKKEDAYLKLWYQKYAE